MTFSKSLMRPTSVVRRDDTQKSCQHVRTSIRGVELVEQVLDVRHRAGESIQVCGAFVGARHRSRGMANNLDDEFLRDISRVEKIHGSVAQIVQSDMSVPAE